MADPIPDGFDAESQLASAGGARVAHSDYDSHTSTSDTR